MTEPVLVSSRELAQLFACSVRMIEKLTTAGVIVRVRQGRYDRDASITAYICQLRTHAAGRQNAPMKDQALAALIRLRDAQTARIEDQRRREEVAVIERSEHHRLVALTAFSFRAAMQDASDIIGRRLGLDKASWDFVQGTIDARLVHYTGLAANRMGLPEQELGILLGQIRENYIAPEGGWLHPSQSRCRRPIRTAKAHYVRDRTLDQWPSAPSRWRIRHDHPRNGRNPPPLSRRLCATGR